MVESLVIVDAIARTGFLWKGKGTLVAPLQELVVERAKRERVVG